MNRNDDRPVSVMGIIGMIVAGIAALAVVIVAIIGIVILAGSLHGGYSRSQRVKNARNHVLVVEQQIKQQQQQVLVVEQLAEQRYQEAIGIKRAQDEINSTLTDRYIQHEAIQAQEAIANSGRNNTVIYVPSGPNGVPIQVTDPAAIAGQDKATSPG